MLRFLSSVPLAILLIAALAGFSVASTLYNLPEIFQSWPFRTVAIAFFINLFLCSVQLWPGLFRTLTRQPGPQDSAHWPETSLASQDLEAALRGARFQVKVLDQEGDRWVLGRKNRLGLLGPHILHLGLLLILVGAFFSTFQTQGQLALYEDQTHPLPAAVAARYGDVTITVEDFSTVYDQHGALDNWVTTFTLEDQEGSRSGLSTRVNAPYKDRGLTIYQMAYDNRYLIQLQGTSETDGDYALPEGQRFPMGLSSFQVVPMTEDLPLLMVYDENDELVDQVALYRDTAYAFPDGSSLTYLGPHFATILQIKYDRSTPLIFAGFIVAVLGSFALLTGRYEEVRIHIPPAGPGRVRVHAKTKEARSRLVERLKLTPRKADE